MSHEVLEQNKKAWEIIRMCDLVKEISLSRSTILRMVKAGEFPRPRKIGMRSVGWQRKAIESWSKKKFGDQDQ